jgi:hypothetical protein
MHMRRRWLANMVILSLLGFAPASAGVIDALKIARNNKPPPFAFDARKTPPAPDYASRESWAALPDMRDEADLTPGGVSAIDQARAPADVFFIYPTVFFSKDQWNADIADPTYRKAIGELPLRSQATIFNGCCAVYAPHYRQMTLGGYVKWSANSEAAMDLAYADVSRAFDQYLRSWNRGRPFIIAAHSQGSRIARRLLAERIDGTPLAKRMIAAYLVGHWMEQSWFDARRDIKPCAARADLGCVVTYSTFEEGRDAAKQRLLLGRTSNYQPETLRRPYVCINPLDWSRNGARVDRRHNSGGWMPSEGGGTRLDPEVVSARCDDGAVYISQPPKTYADRAIPFGNYHNVDYNLFWMNLRQNAAERAAAFGHRPR